MSKKNIKEDLDDGFKKSVSFFCIHSIGDFFKITLKGGLEVIRAIITLTSCW